MPPWRFTRSRTSASPMPSPLRMRSGDSSTWTKRSQTCASLSGEMPMPLSRTRITTSAIVFSPVISMRPPGSVYLAALRMMFSRICCSLTRSATTCKGSRGSCTTTSCLPISSWPWQDSMALRTSCVASSVSRRSSIAPRVMREMSSRSSTRRVICATWRSMVSRSERERCGSTDCERSMCSAARIGASGLRSSCESVARNSFLRWSFFWISS